jgi:hypothetical protein
MYIYIYIGKIKSGGGVTKKRGGWGGKDCFIF